VKLLDLTPSDRILGFFGLAKNTGKTETLNAFLKEFAESNSIIGVTSIGRDGEEFDTINERISKPRIFLNAGSLVATTDQLLKKSSLAHDVLSVTNFRTPMGKVNIARLHEPGYVEVAGPSSAANIRDVCDRMFDFNVDRVLVDGAINRKAASAPDFTDGIIVSTGAVLDQDIDRVITETKNTVSLLRLPAVEDDEIKRLYQQSSSSLLVGKDYRTMSFDYRRSILTEDDSLDTLFEYTPMLRFVLIKGPLYDGILLKLLALRIPRPLTVVVHDSTKVFLTDRSYDWYRKQNIAIEVLRPISLRAVTVNPIAPQSHRFDGKQLLALMREAIPDVNVFDVKQLGYI